MKRFTQPWRPCRNLGTQHAGNAACSPRPEVVIAAPVTPAPSLRWTYRGKGGATMPTCRPAVWGVDDRWGDTACSLNACLGASVSNPLNSEVEDFAASSASSNCPNISSGVIVSLHLPPVNAPLPTGNSEELDWFAASLSSRPRLPSHGLAMFERHLRCFGRGPIFEKYQY